MRKLDEVSKYIKVKRQMVYNKILKFYKEKSVAEDQHIDGLFKYVDSLYRAHLMAKISVETRNLSGKDLQHQIDIREDNLERMKSALSEKFDLNFVDKIMNLYNELAKRDTQMHKLKNYGYFKRRKVVKSVCDEMRNEEKTI
ncbi:MAG TPA: hypothetical protein DCO89_00260 [Clostridiales bacterium]|nr:hypothetical protein [Clostridiales bacterium]